MIFCRPKLYASIVFIFCLQTTFGQSPIQVEQKLLASFNKIIYWAEHRETTEKVSPYDSLTQTNEIFLKGLLRYTKIPGTLGYTIKKLQNQGVTIATSEDGLFRIYSWDTETGGTMHIFYTVYQYKSNGKVYSRTPAYMNTEGDAGCFYSNIYSLHANDKTYYLAVSHAILSTRDAAQSINAFCIEDHKLNDTVRLIKTQTRLTNELALEFDFFSVMNHKERPVKLFYYDTNKKTIKFPVVTEKSVVTNKFITYVFTGKYFEKMK